MSHGNKTTEYAWFLAGYCVFEIALATVLAIFGVDWIRSLPWFMALIILVGVPLLNAYAAALFLAVITAVDDLPWIDAILITAAVIAIPVLPSASNLDVVIPEAALILSLAVRIGIRIAEQGS